MLVSHSLFFDMLRLFLLCSPCVKQSQTPLISTPMRDLKKQWSWPLVVTSFMVRNVTYTICEGPKLDA